MRLSSHGPRARAEFRRLVVESQIGMTESELAHRRSRHQWVRARRVERRLAELRALLRDLDGVERATTPSWLRSRFLGRVVSVVWLAGAALLAAELVRNGLHTVAATVGNLAMLALSLLWFVLAVARVPFSAPEQAEAAAPTHPAPPA
jgi:hypothetical protein